MHVDLMQLFPMGITGLHATDHHDDSFFVGLAMQSRGDRVRVRRGRFPAETAPCEGGVLGEAPNRPRHQAMSERAAALLSCPGV
jgi:hypothetical protein